ncbi:MAG: hypothetical protein GY822_26030 [Deltaproteobacteria bacterium]|nr:hypothetical protein [Deltaproteobacteria bacterium]
MRNLINKNLPLLAFLLVGGFAISQDIDNSGRVFPYVGRLEQNGTPITGMRDIQLELFTVSSGGTACHTQAFDDAEIDAGAFSLSFTNVPDDCLVGGEMWIEVSVGDPGDTLVVLGRSRVAAVPFASANAAKSNFLGGAGFSLSGAATLDSSLDVTGASTFRDDVTIGANALLFTDTTSGATYELTGTDSTYEDNGVELRALTNPSSGEPIFRVLSSGGAERLRVEHDGNVSVGNSTNDQDLVVSGNTSTRDLDATGDGDIGGDLVVSGNTSTRDLDATGDGDIGGDLDVGGTVVSTCPSSMHRIGATCINNTVSGTQTFYNALSTCHNEGKQICSYDELIMCDFLNPSGTSCKSATDDQNLVLWTRNRHGSRTEFGEDWTNNLMCFKGDNTADECDTDEFHKYFCCVPGIYSGTP